MKQAATAVLKYRWSRRRRAIGRDAVWFHVLGGEIHTTLAAWTSTSPEDSRPCAATTVAICCQIKLNINQVVCFLVASVLKLCLLLQAFWFYVRDVIRSGMNWRTKIQPQKNKHFWFKQQSVWIKGSGTFRSKLQVNPQRTPTQAGRVFLTLLRVEESRFKAFWWAFSTWHNI